MEAIKRMLVRSGVIGSELLESGVGVVDDFMPSVVMYALYGEKRIFLGDKLSLADVQSKPDRIRLDCVTHHVEISADIKYVLIMTDVDSLGCYCGEYLHWLTTAVATSKGGRTVIALEKRDVAYYIPPRAIRGHKIVLTLFKMNGSQQSRRRNIYRAFVQRALFSTRDFAKANGLGLPLAAAFGYIKKDDELPESFHCKEEPKEDDELPESFHCKEEPKEDDELPESFHCKEEPKEDDELPESFHCKEEPKEDDELPKSFHCKEEPKEEPM